MAERRPLLDLDAGLPPGRTFLAGLLSVPAFLLTENLGAKLGLCGLYLLLMAFAGLRIRITVNLLAGLGIVAANLVSPHGRVLAEPFGMPLTQGALEIGLARAATILGLIFCSRLTVRPGLRLPGRFGGLLGLMFFYFERITARRTRFDWKRLWESLDALLSEAYRPVGAGDAENGEPTAPAAARLTPAWTLGAAAFIVVHWAALVSLH